MIIKSVNRELSSNSGIFEKLLSGLDQEVYLWRSEPEKWCLLEIICHLYDEEREDFRFRIKHIFSSSAEPFPAIHPTAWVQERDYIKQDYSLMIQKFKDERENSIDWLQSLENEDWNKSHSHPKFGRITAKMLLVNWLAHDYLHIKQITRLKYDYLKSISGENLDYAGEWK